MATGTASLASGNISASNQLVVASVKKEAEGEIAAVDSKAMSEIGEIYCENGMVIEPSERKSTAIGVLTTDLAVVGAGEAARRTTMGSLDLGRIAAIEQNSKDQINSIDKRAGDKIAAIHESEGKWFDRPDASRAASAAAAAGLGLVAVKKIASIEETAGEKIAAIDNKAAKVIAAADKKHAIHMFKCAKKDMSIAFWDGEEDAAATKYLKMEEAAADKIAQIDEKAEKLVRKVYNENGKELITDEDYFTVRGMAGPTATAAAIATAAKMAEQRRANFSNKRASRTVSQASTEGSDSFLGIVGNTAHLAVYDLGAGVAAMGKAITGADLEGPAEYDVRSDWTAQQRASTCCA